MFIIRINCVLPNNTILLTLLAIAATSNLQKNTRDSYEDDRVSDHRLYVSHTWRHIKILILTPQVKYIWNQQRLRCCRSYRSYIKKEKNLSQKARETLNLRGPWPRSLRSPRWYSHSLVSVHDVAAVKDMSLPPQLFRAFENFRDQAKDAIWALSSCLCQQSPAVKINGRTCKSWL